MDPVTANQLSHALDCAREDSRHASKDDDIEYVLDIAKQYAKFLLKEDDGTDGE